MVRVTLGCEKFQVGNNGEASLYGFPLTLANSLSESGFSRKRNVSLFFEGCNKNFGTGCGSSVGVSMIAMALTAVGATTIVVSKKKRR